jgi:hypothetical protein
MHTYIHAHIQSGYDDEINEEEDGVEADVRVSGPPYRTRQAIDPYTSIVYRPNPRSSYGPDSSPELTSSNAPTPTPPTMYRNSRTSYGDSSPEQSSSNVPMVYRPSRASFGGRDSPYESGTGSTNVSYSNMHISPPRGVSTSPARGVSTLR